MPPTQIDEDGIVAIELPGLESVLQSIETKFIERHPDFEVNEEYSDNIVTHRVEHKP